MCDLFSLDGSLGTLYGYSMAKKKKPTKRAVRDQRVICYFTEDDAADLTQIAESLDMSRSTLIVAVLERLNRGGFSPLSFMKTAFQVQRRAREKSSSWFPHPSQLDFDFRPPKPLPRMTEEEPTDKELNKLIKEARTEQKQETEEIKQC